MPYMVNGIGSTVYQGRGNVGWGSFDAVEWFVILHAPLFPLRTIHTFNWRGAQYQLVPIRWSAALVFRSFSRVWGWLLIVVGCLTLLISILIAAANPPGNPDYGPTVAMLVGAFLAVFGGLLHFVLAVTDRRTLNIRRVLGPYELGSCDPALMKKPMNPDPRELFGAESYADAVPALLDEERYSRAMWAARLSTVWEDAALGEELTDHVLRYAGVPEAIEQVRRKPGCWAEVMLSPADRNPPTAPAADTPLKALPPHQQRAIRAERLSREFADPSQQENAKPIRARDDYQAAPRSNQGLLIGLLVGGAVLLAGLMALGIVLGWQGGAANQPVAPAPAPFDPRSMPSHSIFAHSLLVQHMLLSPDGTVVASSDQQTLKLWDPAKRSVIMPGAVFDMLDKPLASFTFPKNPVSALAFTPDGTQLAVGHGGEAVELRDGQNGNLLPDPPIRLTHGAAVPDQRPTRCLTFSPDGQVLAVGRSGDVHLWEVEAGKQQRLLKAAAAPLQALAYSPDGKTLATAGRDNLVKLWDTDTWTERFVLRGHTKDVTALSFTSDGTRLASAGADTLVLVWDVAAGKELGRLTGNTAAVLSVAYSPGGKLLATGSADATLRLWDAHTFAERWQIRRPNDGTIDAAAFSPDGEILFATYWGMIELWDVSKLLGP